jgi:hypothetical protein
MPPEKPLGRDAPLAPAAEKRDKYLGYLKALISFMI